MSCISFRPVSAQKTSLADSLANLTLYQVLLLGLSHLSSRVALVLDAAVEAKDAQSVAEGFTQVTLIN
jgi:hypothetical protein